MLCEVNPYWTARTIYISLYGIFFEKFLHIRINPEYIGIKIYKIVVSDFSDQTSFLIFLKNLYELNDPKSI